MSDKFHNAAVPTAEGESFRELLAAERAATLAQIAALSREFEGSSQRTPSWPSTTNTTRKD